MKICAYFTSEAYFKAAQRMRLSAVELGLDVDIRKLQDLGTWEKNVAQKPAFAIKMLEEHGQDIILVDTDAYFHARPDALIAPEFAAEVALFVAGNGKPSSGTMYFRNGRKSRLFLRAWEQSIENHPEPEVGADVPPREYTSLASLVKKPLLVPIHILGPEYFWVERSMRQSYPGCKPVIEHFMVSKE